MKIRIILSIALVVTLILSACSGGGNNSGGSSRSASTNSTSSTPNTSSSRPSTPSAQRANPASDFEYYHDPSVGGMVIANYVGDASVVVIPAEIDGQPVVSIGKEAFYEVNYNNRRNLLKSVTIPDSVRFIGERAFRINAELAVISIGNGVETIGDEAFKDCFALTQVELPDNVRVLGDGVFEGCRSLTILIIGAGLEKIGTCPEYPFEFYGVNTIILSDNNPYFTSVFQQTSRLCYGSHMIDMAPTVYPKALQNSSQEYT